MKLIEKMADAIHHRDSTDCMAISRVAAKVMLDDMREWADKNVTEKEFFKALLDAYEKERLDD